MSGISFPVSFFDRFFFFFIFLGHDKGTLPYPHPCDVLLQCVRRQVGAQCIIYNTGMIRGGGEGKTFEIYVAITKEDVKYSAKLCVCVFLSSSRTIHSHG